MTDPIVTPDRAGFEALVALREGRRNTVYHDSKGIPTVGIGHRVVPADQLSVGDVIDDARVDALFAADSEGAWNAAAAQAAEAGITDPAFLPYLASVCFQLGVNWTAKWPHTWAMICRGDYAMAAAGLGGTPWAFETPQRVADFQGALRRLSDEGSST